MNDLEIINTLGNVFANAETDALDGLLADDCIYVSNYNARKQDMNLLMIQDMIGVGKHQSIRKTALIA